MTDLNGFVFTGEKLSDADIPRIGAMIGIKEDLMHATIETETGNRWTDSKGRLPILYEPHVAYREAPNDKVRNALVKAGLAYKKWGEKPYPKDSYPRLLKAMEIDEETALRACSWAAPQILGEEFAMSGYASAKEMVLDFLKSEANQLTAMVKFIRSKKLDDDLRALQAKVDKGQKVTPDDCRPFVRGYNGSGYEKNDYHTKYAANLNKWIKIPDTPWTPDGTSTVDLYDGKRHPEVENVQKRLDELKYPEVGTIDGKWGSKTAAAILAFRNDNGLPTEAKIDTALLTALMTAKPREVSAARANATVDDLRKEDAPEIKQTDQTKLIGYVAASGGALTAADKALNTAEEYSSLAGRAKALIEPVTNLIVDNVWLILIAIGAVVVWKSGILQRIRLEKHQTGQDVSA